MADHIDGPRSIGDPSIDLTDLFAFTSPENPARTVLAADVFPSAGVSAMFSNVVNHAIVVRRVSVAGLGDGAAFKADDAEIRFSCRFSTLEAAPDGSAPVQRGTLTCPDGQVVRFVVHDEAGAATPDGAVRVYAGLRSDPFNLPWLLGGGEMKPFANLLEHDNVLCIVVDFDTVHVLAPARGSLFGVIAETTPLPRPGSFVGHEPPRYDWIGKPEQTNMRLNTSAFPDAPDLRDLWNQQTPFAVAPDLRPLFHERLVDSLTVWDQRDGKRDWTDAAIKASANVFLDDFLLFDVAKPITDSSHFEIERSTLNGTAYQTGGGRTLDANCIDILLNWTVNRDQGPVLKGGAAGPTQPGMKRFPYLAPPNRQMQVVAETVDLPAPPDQVWALVGPFGGMWHPLIAKVVLTGTGTGQLRSIETVDGKQIIERLEAMDDALRSYRYGGVTGIQASDYTGTLSVSPSGAGCSVQWRVQYLADGQPDIIIKTIVSTLQKVGLGSLKKRFDAAK